MAERITITTEELRKKQEKWLQFLKNTKSCLEELEGLFDRLDNTFWGNPVAAVKTDSLKKLEEERRGFVQLEAHLGKLTEIAAIYEQAEGSSQDVTVNH